jgi:hypothetical protein
MSVLVVSSMSGSAIPSEIANLPPGRSTCAASAIVFGLSPERLMTQLEQTAIPRSTMSFTADITDTYSPDDPHGRRTAVRAPETVSLVVTERHSQSLCQLPNVELRWHLQRASPRHAFKSLIVDAVRCLNSAAPGPIPSHGRSVLLGKVFPPSDVHTSSRPRFQGGKCPIL